MSAPKKAATVKCNLSVAIAIITPKNVEAATKLGKIVINSIYYLLKNLGRHL